MAYPSLVASALLDAYFERVGVSGRVAPDLDTLKLLHAAHVEAIPFENLDILLGRGVHLDIEALRDKLIAQRRGGYCFEQNTLFLTILRELGFTVTPMEARVRAGATAVRARTHMVLVVELDGAQWLADVGFGGEGLREPVRIGGEGGVSSSGVSHRVFAEGDLQVLQQRREAGWEDEYAFLMQPVHPVDFEMANWFTSTHPQSPFTRTLTVQRITPDARHILRYPTYVEIRDGAVVSREITRDGLIPLLRDVFLIDLPDDTSFPSIDGPLERALV